MTLKITTIHTPPVAPWRANYQLEYQKVSVFVISYFSVLVIYVLETLLCDVLVRAMQGLFLCTSVITRLVVMRNQWFQGRSTFFVFVTDGS